MGGVTLNTAAILNGGAFTAATGSNRRIVAIGAIRRDTGTPVYSATFGGVAMSSDVVSPLGGSGDDQCLVFSLTDTTGIPSGSQVLNVTASGGTILTAFHGQIYTLGGVSQTALDTTFNSSGVATATTSVTSGSLTNSAGSVILYGARDSTGDAITGPGGWTVDANDTSSGGLLQVAHIDNATGATGTLTWSSLSNNWIFVTVGYQQVATGGARQQTLPLLNVGALAPLAWIINRRNKLRKGQILLPKGK